MRWPLEVARAKVAALNAQEDDPTWRWCIHEPGPYRDLGEYAAIAAIETEEDGTKHLIGYWRE